MKKIQTIENLYFKALDKGQATINGRMSLGWGMVGELEPKYEIYVNGDIISMYHWGTKTIEYDTLNNSIVEYYGESVSDRDSLNTFLWCVGCNDKFRYFPSKDLFILNSELGGAK